ncbi:MAG: hypothetical protein KDC52_09395 [Ignavibacteriae bacterium]|nr:hypothetical protein [Ignavibacteriota bacterium]MCB9248108.1 hypothetical protein [Ignavibacteriales bacterium]
MGQQQLLLIVLGVIIVGIAVVVGINVFTASSKNANRDAIIADLTTVAAMAQQHFRKPTAMGGGGNSFTGFTIPSTLRQTANMSAAMANPTIVAGANGSITFTATSTETGADGAQPFTVTMKVSKNQIDTTTFSNF